MKRSLHREKDHPEIAVTLHSLGVVSRQAGDLKGAKQQRDDSERMHSFEYQKVLRQAIENDSRVEH